VTTTVLSAAGIADEGLFNAHLLLAETEQAMLKAAGRVIVVADSSKFGQKSLTLVSALEKVNVFVSDDGLSAAWRERIAKAGARLIVAEVPPSEADASPVSPISRRNRPA